MTNQYQVVFTNFAEADLAEIVDYRELVDGNYRILYHVRDRQVYILAILDARRNLEELIISKLMGLK